MKSKLILITYLNNGNLESEVAKEYIYGKLIGNMISEGRKLSYNNITIKSRVAKFEDGTKIMALPFGTTITGMRFTQVYVDDSILLMPHLDEQSIKNMYLPAIIHGDFSNYDTTNNDKLISFNFSNRDGQFNTKVIE